jgi:predicted RNA-binding Zn-ribbon protein involved in translation (DUF1610 family)
LQCSIVGIKFSEDSGLQIDRDGVVGMSLIVLGVMGVVGSLFGKKASRRWGFGEVIIGILVIFQVVYVMSFFANVLTESSAMPNAVCSIGSGVYLAITAAVLVIIAGLATGVKVKSTKQVVKTTPAVARSTDSLRGSFELSEGTINEEVGYGSPGVYVLGSKKGKVFTVKSVGRSDNDLNARLKELVDKYERFKFEYFDTPEKAFMKECELYHEFGGEKGKLGVNHPERPQGATWLCPRCNQFSLQHAAQAETAIKQNQSTEIPQQPMKTKAFCTNCGKGIILGSKFCHECGSKQSLVEG